MLFFHDMCLQSAVLAFVSHIEIHLNDGSDSIYAIFNHTSAATSYSDYLEG